MNRIPFELPGQEAGSAKSGAESAEPPLVLQYWSMALRHRWVVLGVILGSIVVGILATLLATPQYSATSRIEISRQQQRITNVQGVESEETGRDLEFYFTQYSLLEARSLAERVSRQLNLPRNEAFFAAHGVEPEGGALLNIGGGDRPLDSAALAERQNLVVETLLSHVAVNPIRSSALVDVSYSSASPSLSAQIANAWVQQFIAQSMDRRFESTADARRFLEARLDGLRQRVEQSERDLVNYASRRGIVRLPQESDGPSRNMDTLAGSNVRQISNALAQATVARVDAEGKLDAARARRANEAALQNPALNELRKQLAEVESEYSRALVQFEPEYPTAKALREKADSLKRSIAAQEGRAVESYLSNFEAAAKREDALKARLDKLLGQLNREQRDSIQYNIYQREADTNRQLYDGLLQRYKEIGVAGVGANNISVVDAATVPERPSSPRLAINLLMALAAGLALAAAAVFVLENLDEGLREPDQVRQRLGLPLLGAVPMIEDGNVRDLLANPKSSQSDAYFTVRTNLGFSTDHGVPQSLMTTSTSPSEGKSTTSFALATILGRTGRKVILIDADLRKPTINKYFDAENEFGTSNYLAGDDNLDGLIQPTRHANLSFMASGPMPPNPAELLGGRRLQQLIAELRKRFDHVIVDSPPMLGFADAPLVANAVEGVVYVVESQRTPARGATLALRRLAEAHARVFGVVLTKYRVNQAGYAYGYGYGYGYGSDARHKANAEDN